MFNKIQYTFFLKYKNFVTFYGFRIGTILLIYFLLLFQRTLFFCVIFIEINNLVVITRNAARYATPCYFF